MSRYLAIAVLMLLLSAPAGAGERASAAGKLYMGIDPFIADVKLADGRTAGTPITPYLAVHNQEDFDDICRWMPRIREAIVVTTRRHPLQTKGTYINTAGFAERLRDAINRRFGRKVVQRVYLAKGVPSKSSAAGARLSGGRLGCQRILELPDKVERYRR